MAKKPIKHNYNLPGLKEKTKAAVKKPAAKGRLTKPPKPPAEKISMPENDLLKLVKDTGNVAQNTAEPITRGNIIEKTFIERDTPELNQAPPPEPEPKAPPQAAAPTPAGENDAVAQMLNGAAMMVGDKAFDKNPKECVLTEEQINAIHNLQPEGGIQTRSWTLYILAAVSMIAVNTMNASVKPGKRKEQKQVSMDDLISQMEKQGYKVERPANHYEPYVSILQKAGFKVTGKDGTEYANVISETKTETKPETEKTNGE